MIVFLSQERRLQNEVAGSGIDPSILPSSTLPFVQPLTYTLKQRLSAAELIKNYCHLINSAQEQYKEKIRDAELVLKRNLLTANKMDNLFKEADEESKPENPPDQQVEKPLTGDQARLTCPILGCNVKTLKLRRHIENIHSSLPGGSVDTAMQMAKLMNRNTSSETEPNESDAHPKRYKRENKVTGLVKKKDNFKQCKICSKLVINMTNHIKKTHKISKEHCRYHSLITTCEVVPRCLVSFQNGIPQLKTGNELVEAKAANMDLIAGQRESLEMLKKYREEMEELKLKLEIEVASDVNKEIEMKLAEVYNSYKSLRYKDTRKYSDAMKLWMESFQNHLEKKRYANCKKMATMAMDVILPFEEISERVVSSNDLLDARTVSSILEAFDNKLGKSCGSKIKYVGQFSKVFEIFAL